MELNTGQWVVIGICALLILGYIRGYFYNRQHAARVMAWLLEGLKPWGKISSGEKLPGMSTGGRLEVQQAAPPFKNVEAVFLLAPRENPLFWIFYRLQGKRDELIVWITFQSKPEQSLEVARKGDRQFEKRLQATDKPSLVILEPVHKLQVAVEEKEGAVLAGKVLSFVERYHPFIRRLALRPDKPHLFLRADLQAVQSSQAVEIFNALGELRK